MDSLSFEDLGFLRDGFVDRKLSLERRKIFNFLHFNVVDQNSSEQYLGRLLNSKWFQMDETWNDESVATAFFSTVFEIFPWGLAARLSQVYLADLCFQYFHGKRDSLREEVRQKSCAVLLLEHERKKAKTEAVFKDNGFILTGSKMLSGWESLDCAVVFANLVDGEGKERGLCPFFISLRTEEGALRDGCHVTNGEIRFYGLRLERHALLNKVLDINVAGVTSKRGSLSVRQCMKEINERMRSLMLCANTSLMGLALRWSTKYALTADSGKLMKSDIFQRSIMGGHCVLLCLQLLRGFVAREKSSLPPALLMACHWVYCEQTQRCLQDLTALYPQYREDDRLLLRQMSSSVNELKKVPLSLKGLARWIVEGYKQRYNGMFGALSYVRKKIYHWFDRNPWVCRKTAPQYLRSSSFQRDCLRYRMFVLCALVLEQGSDYLLQQLARNYVTMVTLKALQRAEESCLDTRSQEILARQRSIYMTSELKNNLSFFVIEGFMAVGQARALETEYDVLVKESVFDIDVLVTTSRDPRLDILNSRLMSIKAKL